MRPLLLFLNAALGGALAARIPLSFDDGGPVLRSSDTGLSLSWSGAAVGRLLHRSRIVEVGPRGLLFLSRGRADGGSPCPPSPEGLCRLPEGLVLPSATTEGFPVAAGGNWTDPVLRAFAGESGRACGARRGGGAGRAFGPADEYTVTACDVVQGTRVLVYAGGRLRTVEQTFGPTAYLVVLVSATLHICALGAPGRLRFFQANGALSVLACVALHARGILRFHVAEDQVLFLATAAGALGYVGLPEGYILALSTLAAALYRTHETPYAPILAYILGYRTVQKALALCHGRQQTVSPWYRYADLLASLAHTTVFCEVAVRPQCLHPPVWPLFYTFHVLLCFHIVKYQELSR